MAVVALCFFCLRDNEPSYNGRTLSEWLEQHGARYPFDRSGNAVGQPMDAETEAADAAIRKIGTNAIPLLLKWGTAKVSKTEPFADAILQHLPDRIADVIAPTAWKMTAQRKRDFYSIGFNILGTNAIAALPELARRFNASTNKDQAVLEALCLQAMGDKGVEAFAATICKGRTNLQAQVSMQFLRRLGRYNTNAEAAVPTLLQLASGGDASESTSAMITLGQLALSPSVVVPTLESNLSSTNAVVRRAALSGLWGYETNAASAAPLVRAALNDTNKGVRSVAEYALPAIGGKSARTNSEVQ